MLSLGISVEGKTEALFCKYVLSRYLIKYNILLQDPVILHGNITINRVVNSFNLMQDEHDYVTSFYDFYGFEGKELNETRVELINRIYHNSNLLNKSNLLVYIQQYEFESLLFSDISAICSRLARKGKESMDRCMLTLTQELNGKRPEELNDSILSAPSKRLLKVFRRYKKDLYGFVIAQDISIDKIRNKCEIFNSWIDSLIKLNK